MESEEHRSKKRSEPEGPGEEWEFSTRGGLQAYTHSEALDLPEQRRDISKPENIRWLLRNIVPEEYREGLRAILRHSEKKT